MPRNNGPWSGTRRTASALALTPMARKKAAGKTDGRGRRERLSSVATAIRLLKAFSEDEVEIGISALSAPPRAGEEHRPSARSHAGLGRSAGAEPGQRQVPTRHRAFSARRAGAPAHERL